MSKKNNKEVVINEKRFFCFLILWILIFSIGFVKKTLQNDTFYTIKIGELIVKNGIDMLDHFSIHNLIYTYPHWLYDVFIYLIYKIGNFNGIYISTIVLNLVLLITIFISTKKITKSYVATFTVTLITAIIMGSGFATARAQLVTYILFVLEIFFIEKYIGNKNKKYLLGLWLISLLICNIHVAVWPFYFILYLPYIAESIISLILKKIKNETKFIKFLNNKFVLKNDIPLKDLLIIIFLSLFTGLLTPIKDTPYTYLYKTMIGNSQQYIQEHQMVSFKDAIFTIIIIVETLFLGFISKIKLRDLFLLLGLGLMAIMAYRHIGLFSVVLPICVARTYNYFIDFINVDIDKIIYKIVRKKVVIIILFILVIVFSTCNLKKQLNTPYINEYFYPVKATEYIKNNIDIKTMRLFNEYNFGSYLLYKDIPVFVDSRADLYTKEFSGKEYDILDDYADIGNNYKTVFDFYDISHILIYKTNTLNDVFKHNKHYKLLYEDYGFVLYERLK